MSRLHEHDPDCAHRESALIDLVIAGRPTDLGSLRVSRVLPSRLRRSVGPFVFWDHMGPATFAPGEGIDVRPHPHIALATMTYLLEGAILHRDSVGTEQRIGPGDVNWMLAGKGIVHSERTPEELRQSGYRLHGIQTWIALPDGQEEVEPAFEHHPLATLPRLSRPGADLIVIAGTAYGTHAPTGVLSPTLFVHARLTAGVTLEVDDTHEERAVYVVRGSLLCDGQRYEAGTMLVLQPKAAVVIEGATDTDVMLLGGAPLGPRHMWWNFVSSSRERIEQAKADWQARRFPVVPGDDREFIPLPT